MKTFFAILLAFVLCQITVSAYAVDACTNTSGVPQFDPNTNGTVTTTSTTPYISQAGLYTWGTAATTGPCPGANATPPGPWSAGYACQLLANGFGGGSTGSLSVAPGFDPTGILLCTINFPPDPTYHPTGYVYAGQCNTNPVCPSGYALNGGICKENTATELDTVVGSLGGNVTRNASGNVTSISGLTGANWSVQTFDAQKRPTLATDPNGASISYTYEGVTNRVHTRTDSNGTITYTWADDQHASSLTLPDGSIYNFTYTTGADGWLNLQNVGVVNGFIGGQRKGTLAPYGVPIPYVTSHFEQRIPTDIATALAALGISEDDLPGEHPIPVGVAPRAANDSQGFFALSYGATDTAGIDSAYPLMVPSEVNTGGCSTNLWDQPTVLCSSCSYRCRKAFGTTSWYGPCVLKCFSINNCY